MEKDHPPPYSASVYQPSAPGFNEPQVQPLLEKPAMGPAHGYPPQQGVPPQIYPPNQGYPPNQMYPPPIAPYPTGPAQPAGAYIQPAPGATTVVVTSPPIMAAYGPHSQPMACPHCRAQITSRVVPEAGMRTHVLALILCMIGCIPCCLIPYCVDSCQNRNHYCPSCNAFLGSYDADYGWGRRF